jgi:hypothetical protein
VAIGASDLPAYANGQAICFEGRHGTRGFSDPDAWWGHRSAISTRKGGGFDSYRLPAAVCSRTGLSISWEAATAKGHESTFVAGLIDTARERGFAPTGAMDKGHDAERICGECEDGDCRPIIRSSPGRGPDGQRLEAGGFQPVEANDLVIANLDPTLERRPPPRIQSKC